jgi:hypothetical protein
MPVASWNVERRYATNCVKRIVFAVTPRLVLHATGVPLGGDGPYGPRRRPPMALCPPAAGTRQSTSLSNSANGQVAREDNLLEELREEIRALSDALMETKL